MDNPSAPNSPVRAEDLAFPDSFFLRETPLSGSQFVCGLLKQRGFKGHGLKIMVITVANI